VYINITLAFLLLTKRTVYEPFTPNYSE